MQTILLVDDDDIVRGLFHNYLEAQGYNMLEARDGREALTIAESFEDEIDFLVTDIVMPRINGWRLAKCFRLLRPDARVILVSGYPQVGGRKDSHVVLAKPIYPIELLAAIKSCNLNGPSHTETHISGPKWRERWL